jgi:hypothetical protein
LTLDIQQTAAVHRGVDREGAVSDSVDLAIANRFSHDLLRLFWIGPASAGSARFGNRMSLVSVRHNVVQCGK